MRLASDHIVIQHGGNAVRLTPSLRAAYRLNAKHGVGKLFQGIAEGRLGVILDIIAEGGAPDFSNHLKFARASLRDTLESLKEPLTRFLGVIFGADDDDKRPVASDQKQTSGKPLDIEAGLTSLYEIGTGWLGWSPEDTWAATPAEIIAAHRGHVAKLKAIHGSAEKDGDQPDPNFYSAERLAAIEELGHDPAFDRAGLRALKAKIAGA